jgi:hypothetical protein
VTQQLARGRQEAPARSDRAALRADLRRRLRDLRRLLLRNVPEARGLLRLVLPEPIISRLMPMASGAATASVRGCTLAV